MKSRYFLAIYACTLVCSSSAHACSIAAGEELVQLEQAYFTKSKTVEVHADCAFTNAGIYDRKSGGPARDLGQGRVYQEISFRSDFTGDTVVVADCSTREATFLEGPAVSYANDSCEFVDKRAQLVGDAAILDLANGSDLRALETVVRKLGAEISNPIARINETTSGRKVWEKDRIDLLCGCKLYYPDSLGAAG